MLHVDVDVELAGQAVHAVVFSPVNPYGQREQAWLPMSDEDLHARAYILVNTYLGMQTLSTWFILLTVLDPVQRHPRFLWEESQNRKHAVAALLLEHGAQNASSLSR